MAIGEISAGGTIIGGMIGQRGAQGISVKKIEKTDTQGLIDTYTITYSNNETSTFEVTNGAKGDKGDTGNTGTSITGVAFGSSSGLVDTYIVSFSNGTTSSFNVTNGKGISNIAYTSTSGLTDTYTITYNDNTISTFSITNGTTFIPSLDENGNLSWSNDGGKINPPTRNIKGQKGDKGDTGDVGNGIASIVKTSSSGLVDTYTITFTDETTTTFDVTNGEDGEVTLEELQNVQAELDKFKMLENALPKVDGEGETISLDKTAKSPMSLTLKGNIEQDGEPTPTNPIDIHIVSGDNEIKVENRNRFNPNSIEQGGFNYHTGENFSGNYSIRNIIYNLKPNTQYTISCNESLGEAAICCFDENGSALDGYASGSTTNTYWSFTTKANTSYIKVRIGNATYPKTTSGSYNVCLVEGTSTDYVPHQEYTKEINLPVENIYETPNTQTLNGVTLTKNNDGTFNLIGTATADTSFYIRKSITNSKLQNGTYTLSRKSTGYNSQIDLRTDRAYISTPIYVYGNNLSATVNITIPNNATVLSCVVYVANGTTVNLTNEYIQLEKGTKANSYTPDGTTPIKVGSIGEYEDEFFKNTIDSEYYDSTLELDKWYLKKRIGKVVLDGSESYWAKSGVSTENVFIGAYNLHTSGTKTKFGTGSKWLVNRFTYGVLGDVDKFNTYNGNAEAGYMFIGFAISTSLANDLAAFKNWLSANNVEVHYVLETPENILLNDTLQETLDSFVSYQEQTNISQTNNDLPFVIKARAIYDLSNLVSRVATLEEGE